MQRVVNRKKKIAIKLAAPLTLGGVAFEPGDRLIADCVEGEGGDAAYVVYGVPRERFLNDFTVADG